MGDYKEKVGEKAAETRSSTLRNFAEGGSVEDQTDKAFGKKEIEPNLLNNLTDFFSRERGLERSKKLEDAIRYYLGPYAGSLGQANQLINPIVGLQDAGEATREGRYMDAVTDTAAAGLPIAGSLAAKPLTRGVQSGIDKAIDAVTEVMTGMTFSKIDPYKIQQVINESNAVLSGANKKINSKLEGLDVEGRLQQSPLGTLERKLRFEQMGKGKGKQNPVKTKAALNLGFSETGFHSTGKYDPSGEIEVFKLPDEVYAAKAATKGITLKEAVQQYGGFQSFDNSAMAHDFLGVHVGTTKAAADRHFSKSSTDNTEGARTYQLALKTNKPFLDGKKPWTEKGLNTFLKKEMAKIKDGMVYEKMQIIRRRLAEQGYTHVPYINNVEDKRNISYAMLVDRPAGKGVNSSAVIRYKDAEYNPLEKSNRNAKYAQGGLIDMNNQTQMAFALGGEAETRDPVSGNDVPPGSLPVEVRDDIPARLSEGEYVVPADVVRFFGVKFFEDIRMQAKKGLQQMDRDGRIGGEPVDDQMISDQDLAQLEGMLSQQGMAAGGLAQGGMMDKLLNAVRTNPVVNERMKAAGIPIEMAVGGSVGIGIPSNSQNVDPRKVDEVIAKIGAAAQQNPELMRMLGERGINVPRTTATQTPEQMQQANSPAATTNPIMNEKPVAANAGGLMGYQEGGTAGYMAANPIGTFDPTKYTTVGGTLFDPNTYTPGSSVPIPEAAPAAVENEQTCAARGLVYDPATKQCAMPTPVNDNNDDNNPEPEDPQEEAQQWYKDEDFYGDPAKYIQAQINQGEYKDEAGLGMAISPVAGVLAGFANKIADGVGVSKARATLAVQELLDNIDETEAKDFKRQLSGAGYNNIGSGIIRQNEIARDFGFTDWEEAVANKDKFKSRYAISKKNHEDGFDDRDLTIYEDDEQTSPGGAVGANRYGGGTYRGTSGSTVIKRDKDQDYTVKGHSVYTPTKTTIRPRFRGETATEYKERDAAADKSGFASKQSVGTTFNANGKTKKPKKPKAKDPVANSGRFKAEGGLITKRKKK